MVLPHKDTTLEQIEQQYGVSVIIPARNELDNITELVERLEDALKQYKHELIFIDDHSTDGTYELLLELSETHPIIVRHKMGKRGKAYSIVEGSYIAQYETVAMIDADLQYPPEALPDMIDILHKNEADVVVANRKKFRLFRKVPGSVFRKHNIDIQSGQKVFRKEVIERLMPDPKHPWAFDKEFLLGAVHAGYQLRSYNITYAKRKAGEIKSRWRHVAKQLGTSAVNLRIKPPRLIPFHEKWSHDGLGFHFKGRKYVTHTRLHKSEMAVERTSVSQRWIVFAVIALLAACFALDWKLSLLVSVSAITVMYFLDLLFNLYLIIRSFYAEPELRVSEQDIEYRENWYEWPRYTIFCPLYKESAVVPQFVQAMSNLDYPKDKLEVQLLLEEDDEETIQNIKKMDLPKYFTILVVPHSMPKTKPKACNYGLQKATGKYAVIYDAEDIPDPLQLKKAVVAFESAGPNVGCIQAKLNYYNWNQNLLTRLFTLEYSLWFNLVLTGLHAVKAPIPLGGTSNHFRVSDLRSLEGWDPFNVTEDADLGMRIVKRGLQTAILDSYTMEEANSHFGGWLKQRSRWIKGYMQTYLVHMRRPHHLVRHRSRHLPMFQLVVGGKIASMLINPILWALTIAYFAAPDRVASFIESLYIAPIFYMGIVALVFGNFLYAYFYMVGAARQQKPELIIFSFFVPLYWLMMSWAALLAARDLLIRPFHWHKTKHGLHLASKKYKAKEKLRPEPEVAA